MTRTERRRKAIAACVRFAFDDPTAYDELADSGELRQRVVDAVDGVIESKGVA